MAVAAAAARIFGTAVEQTSGRSIRKLIGQPLIGDVVASWWDSPFRRDILFEDSERAHQTRMMDRARRRGKGPPKKGSGKRAQVAAKK